MALQTPPINILESLNENQRLAASHIEGPLMILAGPGSGKTRVVTHRIANMVSSGVAPYKIAALTFTNKAASELKERIHQLLPGTHVWAGTFHRFCSRLLRTYAPQLGLQENYTIYDTKDSRALLKQAVEQSSVDLIQYSVDDIADQISKAKSRALTWQMFEQQRGGPLPTIASRIYPVYQDLLLKANAVDFDDLLLHVVQLFRESPELRAALDERFQYLLVDEYQDTNVVQYLIIRALSVDHRNVAVTGDPDQSIYGWRGADLNNILNFEKDFEGATIVRLEENYRSTKNILLVADQLIANNQRRKHKSLYTKNEDGELARLIAYPSAHDEAKSIADEIQFCIESQKFNGKDIAILYRANWLSRNVELALRTNGIRYQIINGLEFYQRKEIKDLLAYLRLINNPSDNVSFERIVNVPARKIGKVTIGKLRAHAMQHGVSMLNAAREVASKSLFSKQLNKKVGDFASLMDKLALSANARVEAALNTVIQETNYRSFLMDHFEDGQDRVDNVDELVNAAREFDEDFGDESNLEAFLENTSLVSDTDAMENSDAVTLMTVHASKGLEYPVVYLIGVEEGLLPHERSSTNDDDVEEERRLMFVGITRAQKQLQISRAMSRPRRGSAWPTIASRFLMELPRHQMEVVEPRAVLRDWDNQPYFQDERESGTDWAEETVYLGQDDEPSAPSLENPDRGDNDPGDNDPGDNDPGDNDPGDCHQDFDEPNNGMLFREPSAKDKYSIDIGSDERARDQELKASDPAQWLQSKIKPASQIQPGANNTDQFLIGTMVSHPEYGLGIVETVSGSGKKKTADVMFDTVGLKQFRLAHSKLTVVTVDE